ncbi:chromosomal replication initiator protein DnaA [Patescibacteria group bacterium]|nr:chromosomal replication initiator protein DnaA [Patescibacteria group bacterium]
MDLQKLWKTVLVEIELLVSKPIFQTQFSQSELLSLDNNVAKVGFPNLMIKNLVEMRHYSLIKSILDQHTGKNISVVFTVSSQKQKLSAKDAGPLFSQSRETPGGEIEKTARRLHIRSEYTFSSFAVSTSNQIAYAAATAVAKSPGAAYNPLFFYGGVGVGKTHLMHAVANQVLKEKPGMKIVYCMGEEFLNEIIEAIQTKTARVFKQKYRSADLLLVDDVQFIAGKQTAQEEFFHTFNAVHRDGGQIILTSDRAPEEISRLEDRLRSRFEGGLTVDISPPDFELRTAIVNIKAAGLGLDLSPESSRVIAANLTDTRSIEGFLKRIITEVAARPGTSLTPEFISSLLGSKAKNSTVVGMSDQKTKKRVTPQEVLDVVARYFNIKSTTLKGPKRDRPIARPRQVVMYLCKTELGMTLEDIGGLLGGRDHTTVMYGADLITNEISTNVHLRDSVEGIKRALWG